MQLEIWRFFCDQLLNFLYEFRCEHIFRLLFSASADIDFPAFGLFIANNQQERHFLHRVFADLRVHFFIAGVDVETHASSFELFANFIRVIDVALGDGNHDRLYWRKPNRKCSRVVFNQHTEEPLHRSKQRAMHHDWLFAGTVFGDVFKSEAGRKIEVELDGRELPQTADGVDQLDIDFRPVKCAFAGDGLVLDIAALEDILQRGSGVLPILFLPTKLCVCSGSQTESSV